MKHKFLVLGVMLSCLLCFTGCGKQEQQTAQNSVDESRYIPKYYDEDHLKQLADDIEDDFFEAFYKKGVTPENFEEKAYLSLVYGYYFSDEKYETFRKGYESWYKAIDQIGYGSKDTLADDINVESISYEMNNKGQLVLTGRLHGTKHYADMVIYLDNKFTPTPELQVADVVSIMNYETTDIGVTADKTIGEKLENAGLNTLMGMGMAFSILITISLIICLFPLIQKLGTKKNDKKTIAEKAIDNTVGQIAEKEDLSSDAELVAVIAAAIAAYEGSGSTDGFRVRSIRKVNSNWKKF
ncbi:OadG family transporter subunit [Butyrivibrio sp. X503]|uniref:OadG family transporter subunit n=1 Tax=Butyrivibrio sp. X503 TaxID=2364878 RepID=UPI0013141CFF|nr:OadG family transporter subunit [Butyrivibrio sp. X503]